MFCQYLKMSLCKFRARYRLSMYYINKPTFCMLFGLFSIANKALANFLYPTSKVNRLGVSESRIFHSTTGHSPRKLRFCIFFYFPSFFLRHLDGIEITSFLFRYSEKATKNLKKTPNSFEITTLWDPKNSEIFSNFRVLLRISELYHLYIQVT